jgi:hypothetical protein
LGDKQCPVIAEFGLDRGFHFICLMADDYQNFSRANFRRGAADVRDERTAVEFVQDLRHTRLHSSAKTGCQDQYIEGGGIAVGGR